MDKVSKGLGPNFFFLIAVALGIRVFGSVSGRNHSVSGRNHSVPGISDKLFLYPICTYDISVRFRFGFRYPFNI